jgi:glycosyltransferase involved in cell wall biosynthesis
MRVGIEGSLFLKRSTGVGYYAKMLTQAAAQVDSEVKFEIVKHVFPWSKPVPPLIPNEHLGYRFVRWFPPAVYYQVFKRLNWFIPYDLIALRRYKVFLFFNFTVFPVRRSCRSVVVIHDLSFILYPQFTQAKNLKYQTKLLPRSIRRASHIITVSENSKREIVEHYGVQPEMISVVSNAVDHDHFKPRPNNEVSKVRQKYGLPAKFIHFHGTIEPRKNVQGLLDAYANLPDHIRDDYALVLTGGKGWQDEAIYQRIDQLKSNGLRIVLPGYVDNEDLPAIYSAASLFVFPSFYEGFGVPPLEAMACGVPVISSNSSSLPEVVSEAAIKVSPKDTAEITKQIMRVLKDPTLAKTLSTKGINQAKKFSWDQSAKKLIKVLDDLA